MIKSIFQIITSVIWSLAVIFATVSIWIHYFAWLAWKVRNGEDFCINKQYSIWKILWGDDWIFFCDNTQQGKCINSIESYTLWENKDLYLNFMPSVFIWKTEEEINQSGYIYNIFSGNYSQENKYYTKNYDEIIRFLKLNYNDCSINFYSNNDLETLNEEDRENFKISPYK